MNITVWSDFSKRENSTKQPGGGQSIDVKLKDNCSIENPIFLLASGGGMPDYTYAEAFGHYYYVTDIISVNASMAEIHCKQDVLATYKGEIGATRAFVLYDTTANTHLRDPRLSTVDEPIISRNKTQLHSAMNKIGTFIVTVTGVHSTDCYVISALDVDKLIPDIPQQVEDLFMTGFTPAGDWSDFVPAILRALKQLMSSGNLEANIRDLRWIPFNISGVGSHQVKVGMYETDISNAGKLSLSTAYRLQGESKSLSIPWNFSDWRNAYNSNIYLHLPYIGDVSFPASELAGETGLMLNVSVDMVTGDMAVVVTGTTTGVYLGSYGAATGVTIPIGNASPSLNKMVTSLMGGITSTRSQTSIAGIFGSAFNTIGAMAEAAMTPYTQSIGGLSSAASAALPFDAVVAVVSHDTNVPPSSVSSVMGTPAMAVKTIGNLSGYVQCQNASVEGNMRSEDRNAINAYLNSGFFYE